MLDRTRGYFVSSSQLLQDLFSVMGDNNKKLFSSEDVSLSGARVSSNFLEFTGIENLQLTFEMLGPTGRFIISEIGYTCAGTEVEIFRFQTCEGFVDYVFAKRSVFV